MDKISGIVPASPRVTAVDVKEASPVRPGTPAFGRPEGASALKDKDVAAVLGTAPKSVAIQNDMMDWRSKDAAHAALVTKLSDNFFNKTPKPMEAPAMNEMESHPAARVTAMRDLASRPAGFKTDEGGAFRAGNPRSFADLEEEFESEGGATKIQQPEGLFPKGSFIDRSA